MIEVSRGLGSQKKNILLIIVAVAFVALAAVAGYFIWQYIQLKNNPNVANDETVTRLTTEVGKLYALPGDEKPTVAQVQDKEKLKDQAFFDKSENGDYILIYTNAKLALLYREKDNKLINVGPVSISDQQQQGQAAGAQTQQPQQPATNNKKP